MSDAHLRLIGSVFETEIDARKVSQHLLKKVVGHVCNSLTTLNEREQGILKRRFGIGYEQRSLKQVGQVYGMTPERARQIESKALHKLRHPSRNYSLRKWLGEAGLADMPDEMDDPQFLSWLREQVRQGRVLTDEELDKVPCEIVVFSPRARNVLKNAYIGTLLDLRKQTRSKLLREPNFGNKSLAEVEEVAAEFGVFLQDDH